MPSFDERSELVIEHGSPNLQKCVRLLWAPGHLLLFDKALAYHLVDGRLDETGGNRLPTAIAVTVVHEEAPVVIEVDDELLELGEELGLLRTGLGVEIPAKIFQPSQLRTGAAVPEVPLGAAQDLDQICEA
ncbi:hypothetical protein CS8_010210 [Cupriavidus sp. 8B]